VHERCGEQEIVGDLIVSDCARVSVCNRTIDQYECAQIVSLCINNGPCKLMGERMTGFVRADSTDDRPADQCDITDQVE